MDEFYGKSQLNPDNKLDCLKHFHYIYVSNDKNFEANYVTCQLLSDAYTRSQTRRFLRKFALSQYAHHKKLMIAQCHDDILSDKSPKTNLFWLILPMHMLAILHDSEDIASFKVCLAWHDSFDMLCLQRLDIISIDPFFNSLLWNGNIDPWNFSSFFLHS